MKPVADLRTPLIAALAERYTLGDEIGRGGMSIVYRAHDLRHDRDVAIKVLRPELTVMLGPQRFLREIQIAARLQHPHILALHDSGQAGQLLYYVMPLVEGESLRRRLDREGPFAIPEAIRITREVGNALGYAHSQGIVHRDIKPENILLSSGLATVADFGIARAIVAAADDQVTDSSAAVGTPGYMSPEQAAGESRLDGRSDIYSLACVLFEMLVGEPPFTGPTPRTVLARHMHERPPSLRIARPTIAPEIATVVERALAKMPADRFTTAAQFVEALEAAAAGVPPRRPIPRRAIAVGGFTIVAVAAGIWYGATTWSRHPPPRATAALDPTHIAVLYFTDRSENGSLRPVAHGLTEDLIDKLSNVQALHVTPPSGVRVYRDKDIALDSVARALGVGTLVEGSVERPNNALSVRVRLIDAVTGRQLQSAVLQRPWGDLFALQAELADSISRFLRRQLGREVRLREQQSATLSVPAWELLRQAEGLVEDAEVLQKASKDPAPVFALLSQADTVLARAERLDPHWEEPILARGWLAERQAEFREDETEVTWLTIALGHAERALRLTPGEPRALELRGTLRRRLWQTENGSAQARQLLIDGAEQDLRAAVTANPNLARAWNALSMVYQQRGDWTQADITLRHAIQADAYLTETARSMQVLMFAALERGDSAGARSWCDIGRAQFPDDFHLWECDLTLLGWLSHDGAGAARAWRLLQAIEARDTANLVAPGWGVRRMLIAAILARAGLRDSARHVMEATRAHASATVLATLDLYEAYVLTELGEHEQAIAKLTHFLGTTPQWREYVANARWFTPLHQKPGFNRLVRGR